MAGSRSRNAARRRSVSASFGNEDACMRRFQYYHSAMNAPQRPLSTTVMLDRFPQQLQQFTAIIRPLGDVGKIVRMHALVQHWFVKYATLHLRLPQSIVPLDIARNL